MDAAQLQQRIFSVTENDFENLALEIFRFQFAHNAVYAAFANGVNKAPGNVHRLEDIPFLPVEFFKTHRVYAAEKDPETVFTSSGTTGMVTSRHEVADVSLYRESFLRGFELFYGKPEEWTILALLPSYLEREGSSLVYMADALIRESAGTQSGFYLHDLAALAEKLKQLAAPGKKTLLLGVTYALLDLADKFSQPLGDIVVMETGGMKGKRKEMVREELHGILCSAFDIPAVHSEYGMTELLSQAYSKGKGIFHCPPWMKIMIREMNDPFAWTSAGRTGGVSVIDLANLYSCSFIATSDLGKKQADGSFEILGRFDFSDIRGCNLMIDN